MFWMALIVPLLLQAPPQDDLRKEMEQLRKQNLDLQERLSLLEQAALENAQTIQRLRQMVKLLETNPTPPATEPSPSKGPAPKPDLNGPTKPIRAKLVFVNAKENFIALNVGKKDKVEIGYKFEVYREAYENGGESRLTRLGVGEVEKFLGGQETMAKLIVVEGNASEMKVDDLAVAIRKISDHAPVKEEGKAEPKPEAPEAPKDGVYTIQGRLGGGFIINYGSALGAKQTTLVYVYKDGKFKCKLRLDKVEKQHSVGNVVDGTMELPPDQGDQVYVKELNKSLAGKVALSDDKGGRLAIDLRQRDGLKPGMHCEVRRLGQKLGTILVTEVQNWGSWARPEGDLRIDQIQKGDFVEVIEEK
jgi:hypothetical protein